MSEARKDPNVKQPTRDYDGLYMKRLELAFMGAILRNQRVTLRNQELVFKNQRTLARIIHIMEHTMSKRNRRQGGTNVLVPYTQIRLPLSSDLDVPTLPGQEDHLYDMVVSYRSQKIDLVEYDDDAMSGCRH
ncbi:hypothetical protein Syun_021092 [Stephania yunnanensis]|uniref:Uncharacterized protein n=1 Tax=Stephania yunnanensis TaxID=152371 RepID=A0AAP0NQQ4_9MAGN